MNTVLYAEDGAIAVVTLNRPQRLNAMTGELVEDLCQAMDRAMKAPGVRAIVFTGAGRAFCAGDDLKEFEAQARTPDTARRHLDRIQDSTRIILNGDKPVVAAAKGWAAGGGLEWLINCDFVVMGEGTRCFFPESSLGILVTGAATALLPRLVGLQKAKALMLFGDKFNAKEAFDMGLAYQVVPDDQVLDAAMALARRIADLPEGAVRGLKRVMNRAQGIDLEQVLEMERDAALLGFLDPATPGYVAAAAPRKS